MLAFRSIDPPALRRGGRPKNNLFDGFNRKASADGSIGKNRRSLQAALRKFRTDTERTVEKQTGQLQPVEFTVEVVASDQSGSSIKDRSD